MPAQVKIAACGGGRMQEVTRLQHVSCRLALPQPPPSCRCCIVAGEERLLRRQQRVAGLHGPGAPVQVPGLGAACCGGTHLAAAARLQDSSKSRGPLGQHMSQAPALDAVAYLLHTCMYAVICRNMPHAAA